jgi:hypothetical protein
MTGYPFPRSPKGMMPASSTLAPPPTVEARSPSGSSAAVTDGTRSLHTSSQPVLPSSAVNSVATVSNQTQLSPNSEAAVQTTLNHLLSNPAQMQKLLQALANQPNFQIPSVPPSDDPVPSAPATPMVMHGPNRPSFDPSGHWISHSYAPSPPSIALMSPTAANASTPSAQSAHVPPSSALASYEPLTHESEKLQRTWNSAHDIESDVDALQSSLNQLITQMGFDPSQQTNDIAPADPTTADFDFDTFLNDFTQQSSTSMTGMQPTDEANYSGFSGLDHVDVDGADPADLTAFLDEVASQASDTHSQKSANMNVPDSPPRKKRKSDVSNANNMLNGTAALNLTSSTPASAKPKKRR